MRKSIVCIITVLMLIVSSVMPALADTASGDYGNTALTIINKINAYQPQSEEVVTQTGKPPLETYGRMARYMFYVSELKSLVEVEAGAVLPDWVKNTLTQHEEIIAEMTPYFGVGNNATHIDMLEYLISTSSNQVNQVLDNVKQSEDKQALYKQNFEAVKTNIKLWSDSIKFYHDEVGLAEEKFTEYSNTFNEVYDIVLQMNQIVGMNLNLGFVRPDEEYETSATITNNFMDSERNLKVGYLEIFSLSSYLDNSMLEDYRSKLETDTQKLFDMYSDLRVPLYASNEQNPITELYKGGKQVVKKSSLREFIENPETEQVLYIPIYKVDKSLPTDTVNNAETDETNINAEAKELEYYPVYIRGNKNFYQKDFQQFVSKKLDDGYKLPEYSTAVLNYMQFNNFYENGKTNDYQSDMSYPLFMDAWGNIETYSGKVIIPAVSNMNFYADEAYFPLNAFFINNYPIESMNNSITDLLKINTDCYVIRTTTTGVEDEDIDKDNGVPKFNIVKFQKNGLLDKINLTGISNKVLATNALPEIKPYIEQVNADGGITKIPFMDYVTKNKDSMWGLNSYTYLGLKESVLNIGEDKIPFMFINDSIPVNSFNLDYFYGKDGDKRRLDNDLLMRIAESCYSNPDTDYAAMKSSDTQTLSYGFKIGAAIEPIHQKMSESSSNYNLYTPSIAELPGVNEYISTLLIPALKIALLIAIVFILIRYVRHIKSMSLISLAFALAVVFAVNFAITNLYPAILNTGFNGMVSKVMGENGYYLTLYNIEKDLNSKGEFVYGDGIKNEKIVTPGAYIKVADLTSEEVKRYRAAQENAPYKDSDYYVPEWDTSMANLGEQLFIKGTSLYIYVKDLTSSSAMLLKNGQYENSWEIIPEYTYYMPYLSILDGLTKTVNKYIDGRMTPKTLVYSNGYESYTGACLSYFSNQYFLVDNETARNADDNFQVNWETFNGGDYLNLKNVLYLEQDEQYFPTKEGERVKTSRWYRVATKDLSSDQIQRKILDVNLKTKNFAIEMLPYMNNVSDEMILKMIALYATIEFDKEFSKSPAYYITYTGDIIKDTLSGNYVTDYETKITPQRLELDSISVDEQLKMSLVNVSDLLKFNVTSIYKYVENEASWYGMFLLGANTLLLYVRSLLRIGLISITLVIVLMYAVVVYALQRDYTNKTIIGLIGIVGMSWCVYLVDNIFTIGFMQFDKNSAGILLIILHIWLIWNIASTGVYLLIFEMIRRDITAFGGNIMYGLTASVLNKANGIIKSGLGLVSKTRAENFDITRPDLEMKAEDYAEYLNMDFNQKLVNRQEYLGEVAKNAKEAVGDKFSEQFKQSKTLREMYAEHKDEDEMTIISSMGINKAAREFIQSYGIEAVKDANTGNYVFSGTMNKWSDLIQDNKIHDEQFEYYKEQYGDMFFKDTSVNRESMQKAGINYETLGKSTLAVSSDESEAVGRMMSSLKTPLYKINMDKNEALKHVEGVLSPNEYEIGNNAVYLSTKEKAEEIFGADKVTPTYKTQMKIKDYADKVGSGYVANKLDFNNGVAVTDEYVYGSLSKEVFKDLLEQDIKLHVKGDEQYMFDRENRDKIMDSISKSARYVESTGGVVFTDKTPIDNLLFNNIEKHEKTDNKDSDEDDINPKEEVIGLIADVVENKDEIISKDLLDFDLDLGDKF